LREVLIEEIITLSYIKLLATKIIGKKYGADVLASNLTIFTYEDW
jgi:hypothetical protein